MEATAEQKKLLARAQDMLKAWSCSPLSVSPRGEDMILSTQAGSRILKYYPQGVDQGVRCHMAMEYCAKQGFYSLPRHILNRQGKPLTVYGGKCYGLQDIWQAKPLRWQDNQDLFLLGQTMGKVHTAMMGFHQAYLEQPQTNWLTEAVAMAEIWLEGKDQIPIELHQEWERVCFSLSQQIERLGKQEPVLLEVEAAMPFVHNGFTGKEILRLPQGPLWVGGWENWSGGNALADVCAVLHKIAWQRNWDTRAMEAFLAGYRLGGIFRSDMAELICAWCSLPFAALDLLKKPACPLEEWQPIFTLQRKKEQAYSAIATWTKNYWGGGADEDENHEGN